MSGPALVTPWAPSSEARASLGAAPGAVGACAGAGGAAAAGAAAGGAGAARTTGNLTFSPPTAGRGAAPAPAAAGAVRATAAAVGPGPAPAPAGPLCVAGVMTGGAAAGTDEGRGSAAPAGAPGLPFAGGGPAWRTPPPRDDPAGCALFAASCPGTLRTATCFGAEPGGAPLGATGGPRLAAAAPALAGAALGGGVGAREVPGDGDGVAFPVSCATCVGAFFASEEAGDGPLAPLGGVLALPSREPDGGVPLFGKGGVLTLGASPEVDGGGLAAAAGPDAATRGPAGGGVPTRCLARGGVPLRGPAVGGVPLRGGGVIERRGAAAAVFPCPAAGAPLAGLAPTLGADTDRAGAAAWAASGAVVVPRTPLGPASAPPAPAVATPTPTFPRDERLKAPCRRILLMASFL